MNRQGFVDTKKTAINVFTDGGVRGNGKKNAIGAWACILTFKGHEKEYYRAEVGVTNNQMEMKAIIAAMVAITKKEVPVVIHSDSAYVINAIKKESYKLWQMNGWRTTAKKPVANKELWERLLLEMEKFEWIDFVKVKGHSDNEGNNRADLLVNIAMDNFKMEEN